MVEDVDEEDSDLVENFGIQQNKLQSLYSEEEGGLEGFSNYYADMAKNYYKYKYL